MSKRDSALYLQDILTATEKIEEYIQGLSAQEFNKDWKTIDAVIMNLEIIGEAARNMPEEIISGHPEIP